MAGEVITQSLKNKENNEDLVSLKRSWALSWGLLGAAGIQLAVAVVGGLYLGSVLDERWQQSPLFTIVGLILGAIGGLINLLRLLKYRDSKINTEQSR